MWIQRTSVIYYLFIIYLGIFVTIYDLPIYVSTYL